jgi:hypothetical protein
MINHLSNLFYSKHRKLFPLLIIPLLPLLSCTSSLPLSVTIRELSACKGWDRTGKPVGISRTFLPDEERIYACGRLETNDPPITLVVHWSYEGKPIFREIVYDVDNYFYSSIGSTGDTFPEGVYKIEVVVGKDHMQQVEFRVEQP